MTVVEASADGARARFVTAVRMLAVLVCAAGAAAALVAYRSERRLDEIKRLALASIYYQRSAHGDDPRSERPRREALRLVPSARLLNPDTDIDVQVGLFLETDRRRAHAALERAIHREPENVFLWLALTRRQQREGNLAAAGRSYERARALDPRLPPPR
jgi:tetratricopeptide (TPR) repeat protein